MAEDNAYYVLVRITDNASCPLPVEEVVKEALLDSGNIFKCQAINVSNAIQTLLDYEP